MIVDQNAFHAALLDPDAPRPAGLSDGAGQDAGRRYDVYRNNVAVSLTEALETAFPVVAKLVGPSNFKVLAGVFLRQHPPSSPLMMFYGDEMPSFLSTFAPTSQIGYLPDVARLELALRHSYHAADSTPIDPAVLQDMAPASLMAATLALAPAIRLVRSNWPIGAIWQFNTVAGAPKPEMAAQDVLVVRTDMDPEPILLPSGGGALVDSLLKGSPLGEAVENADTLAETLGLLLGTGSIVNVGD